MTRPPVIGFDFPLPPPGVALRRGHWSTEGLRALLLPNTGSPSIRVYDPVRDLWTPIASTGHAGTNKPTAHGLMGFLAFTDSLDVTQDQSTIINPLQTTIVMVRRLDTPVNDAPAFMSAVSGAPNVCGASIPWGDGNAYWSFGGNTNGVNSVMATAPSIPAGEPQVWVFVAGPHGMAIYQNGVLLASHATAAAGPSYTGPFHINAAALAGPIQTVSLFAVLDAEWNAQQVQEWTDSQGLMFVKNNVVLFGLSTPTPPAGDEFTIDGIARDILQNWSISEQLNERGTMRFGVKSMDATYRPGLREEVDFTWGGRHYFAGHIHHTDEGGLGGYGVVPIVTDCGATDYNALPDRRKRALTLAAGTLKSMLQDVKELLEVYGVTLDPAQVDGPTIADDLVFTLGPLTQVLDKLSLVTGYAWNISYDKVLSMFAPGTENAPFDIEDGDSRVIGDVRVAPTSVDYGNHITVKYTEPAVAAYVYYVIEGLPSEDEWLKLAGQTYTFKAAPSGPNEIQIEATIADQRDAIITAIDPLDEIIATVQAADALRVTAAEVGASGNSINVETNAAAAHWGVEGVPIASHLYNGADAALTGTVIAQDIPAQDGGANLFELVFEEPTAESEATAQALADGWLVRSLVQPREIRYRTRLHGLHPGMKQHIEVPGRNVDADCLITAVDISPEGSALFNYDVTAVEGLVITTSHQEKWRQMGGVAA